MSDQEPILPATGHQKSKFSYFLPVLIAIVITAALIMLMKASKPEVEKKADSVVIPLVETISIQAIDYIIPIISEGMVLPKTSISLSAEISGKVVNVSNNFTTGGEFQKGEVLLEIDPIDYQLAITRAKANVSAQRANLDLEQAKSDLAKEDWSKYGKKGKPSALNLNLPQVASAKAALAGAQADLELAMRNLEKTKIIAPFDGVLFNKQVDLGQFASMGTPVATIASTEFAEIRVSLSDKQLQQSGLVAGEPVEVKVTVDEIDDIQWQGIVTHIEAQRDAQTLLNYAVVSIQNPFNQRIVPLRFNTYVELEFAGEVLNDVYPVERNYMMLNNKLRFLDANNKLRVRNVDVVYSDNDYFYVSKGISDKDNLIITQLPSARSGDLLTTKPATNSGVE
jgi:RND family efflux transporter MFP subunit